MQEGNIEVSSVRKLRERNLRILYVTPHWPHERAFGGQIRGLEIARTLQKLGRVSLVIVGADTVDNRVREKTAAEFDLEREISTAPKPNCGARARIGSFLSSNFTNIHGMGVSAIDESWMMEAIKGFDLIWFFKLKTANMFVNARWQRSVVDIDDVPSAMERASPKRAVASVHLPKTWLRKVQLRLHERRVAKRFDMLTVCSEDDRGLFSNGARVRVIPNGFARPPQVPQRRLTAPPRIGFIGLFTYQPNHEGLVWFYEHCWPQIQARIPGARLRLLGTGTDGPLKPDDPSVDGLGWVDDPANEIASWALTIIPIRSGGGTRVKIADAFSRKCPVVSTTLGAYGYDVQNKRELLLADEPSDFAAACISLIQDSSVGKEMAERAFEAFSKKWTWDAIAPRVHAAAQEAMSSSRAVSNPR